MDRLRPAPLIENRLRTEPAVKQAIPEIVSAPGEVAIDLKRMAKVTSRIEGQVERLSVQLGDHVHRGQPLVSIGSLQLDQLVEEYLVAKAQADVAESSFRRTEELASQQIVTERRRVEERGRHLEAKARYQHVREKLLNMGMSEAELREVEHGSHQESHQYILKAPIAGTVVAQRVVRGEGVAPGKELMEVVDASRVWVFANLPLEQARRFHEGDMGTIVPKGGAPLTAPLTYIAPIADETTRTVKVRFEVNNEKGRLKPNEYVEVALSIEGAPVLAVPVSAVTMVDKTRGVFVRRDDGYVFRPVQTGREAKGRIEILEGVQAGDLVVVDGVFDLKNLLLREHIGSGG
jgi:RND family efflux transporter MFP subunit